MITLAQYNHPLGPGNEFLGIPVPAYAHYVANYEIHFMRYLYYMCCMQGQGEYPNDIALEEIQEALNGNQCNNQRITKILVGEAPPSNPANYFYNPHAIGPHAWEGEIRNALFPGIRFANKIDFLTHCAQTGFLLIDLFPYSIDYKPVAGLVAYRNACLHAFGGGGHAFPYNLMALLIQLSNCIANEFAFGFGLIRTGRPIFINPAISLSFDKWCVVNAKTLVHGGAVNSHRVMAAVGASPFLRIFGKQGRFGPAHILMNAAGI